jgi:hypothetical protein
MIQKDKFKRENCKVAKERVEKKKRVAKSKIKVNKGNS